MKRLKTYVLFLAVFSLFAMPLSGLAEAGSDYTNVAQNVCNPCATKNPCAMNPCASNPCAVNPCAVNPCAVNPCAVNPCAVNPCATQNPCAANPCAGR
jgi:hypothetical protein